MKYRLDLLVMMLLFGVIFASTVLAAPTGPTTYNELSSSSYTANSAANVSAIAGNVTEINFEANISTNTWQGYFGNITGTIVLGNANNQSMYNWNLTSPTGQIYATRINTVPTWTTIQCADQTHVDAEDTVLGVNQAVDQDSVNRTFVNTTVFNPFYVGNVNINTTQNCRATYLNDESGGPSSDFAEVLLSDTTNLIYTGLITSPALGFDSRAHQFQMLVGENGHNGDISATPYYFYLELR